MTIFPSTTSEKLTKLLLMLSSPNSGEVVAAAAAIGRVLEAEHRDWHDLARSIKTPVSPRSNADAKHYSSWHWRSCAEWCAEHSQYMTEWEKNFVTDILKRRYPLSEKQLACLERIRQSISFWKQQEHETA
jgi:uncharacterized membrane protein YccC